MLIDLHTHTTASDGSYSPNGLVQAALEAQINLLSITDHDTLDAYQQLENTPSELRLIPGLEISAEFPKTLHILGYGIDTDYKPLQAKLKELQNFRETRNHKMVENLQKHGFEISWNELINAAGSDLVGRPHFAQLMLQKGYVKNKQEAFDKYLKKGAPFYLNKKRMEPAEAIQLIRAAGGFAALAHPYQTGLQQNELESLIHDLAYEGLQGIEVYYSQHDKEQIKEYKRLATKYDLIITGGSDFHGANKPHIPLGMEIKKDELQKFIIKMRKYF
jgi:hypothetical protein